MEGPMMLQLFAVPLVITIFSLSSFANSLPVESSGQEYNAIPYSDLEDSLKQELLSSLASSGKQLPNLQSNPHIPTDTPSLIDLMRSAMRIDGDNRPSGEPLLKKYNRELLKRSFDSISRSSAFGANNRNSWSGLNRKGDNLTFTFESLFPAIARGLRSIH